MSGEEWSDDRASVEHVLNEEKAVRLDQRWTKIKW